MPTAAAKAKAPRRLSRRRRMAARADYTRLFDEPHVFRGSTLLVFSKASEREHSRVGITIKGRLTSVWRTRLKRMVREAFRLLTDPALARDYNFVIRIAGPVDWKFHDKLQRDIKLWAKTLL